LSKICATGHDFVIIDLATSGDGLATDQLFIRSLLMTLLHI
jgi:hypothetical protein